MKTFYIINPKSGDGTKHDHIIQTVQKLDNAEIYITKCEKDATSFVRNKCLENKEEELRFVACGGDGTINEVFSGAVGFENASVSLLPIGTGNDFAKNFDPKAFSSIEGLQTAETIEIDYMKVNEHFAFNCVNFGFDTTVALTVNEDRAKLGHGSKFSYTKGVAKALITSMVNEAKVYTTNRLINPDGKYLLCVVSNGQFVGGSYHCSPKAELDDGLLDLCLVRPISRLELISIINSYKEGTHLDNEKLKDLFKFEKVNNVRIEANDGFKFSLDGEIIEENIVDIEIVKKGLKLAIIK